MKCLLHVCFVCFGKPTSHDGVVDERTNLLFTHTKAFHQQGIFIDHCVVEHLGVVGVDGDQHSLRDEISDRVLTDIAVHSSAQI